MTNKQTSIMMTVSLLIYTVYGYFKIKEDGIASSYVIIFGAVLLLICFSAVFILCTIKINNKTATEAHMGLINTIPIFGWIYKNSSAYQRMTKKLANDEAIQGCKNAVNNMEINYSKDDWSAFSEWFPKIDTKGNLGIRYSLILRALCAKINHEGKEIREELRKKLNSIKNTKAYGGMKLANFLRIELIDKIANGHTHTESEVTQEALEREDKKRTLWLVKLQDNLTESNINRTFKEMYKIQN